MEDVIPVRFRNRAGHVLFGMLHLPEPARRRSAAILLLSPGVKMRVAPHRLYKKMAARFVALGFPVFRFDFYGLGDSGGHVDQIVLVEVYNSIHNGRYVEDTLDAMDWLEREHGFSRFVAGGLCGGAISALLAAERDRRIEALLALGIPASFEGLERHYDQYLTRGQLESLSYQYLWKLLQPKSLLRFFTFRSSYNVIYRSFRERLRARARERSEGTPPASDKKAMENLNPKFGPAFFSMVRSSRRMILIFSGNDRWRWEFQEKFEEPNAARLETYRTLYETHTIPGANHILSQEDWLGSAMDLSRAWLDKLYPA